MSSPPLPAVWPSWPEPLAPHAHTFPSAVRAYDAYRDARVSTTVPVTATAVDPVWQGPPTHEPLRARRRLVGLVVAPAEGVPRGDGADGLVPEVEARDVRLHGDGPRRRMRARVGRAGPELRHVVGPQAVGHAVRREAGRVEPGVDARGARHRKGLRGRVARRAACARLVTGPGRVSELARHVAAPAGRRDADQRADVRVARGDGRGVGRDDHRRDPCTPVGLRSELREGVVPPAVDAGRQDGAREADLTGAHLGRGPGQAGHLRGRRVARDAAVGGRARRVATRGVPEPARRVGAPAPHPALGLDGARLVAARADLYRVRQPGDAGGRAARTSRAAARARRPQDLRLVVRSPAPDVAGAEQGACVARAGSDTRHLSPAAGAAVAGARVADDVASAAVDDVVLGVDAGAPADGPVAPGTCVRDVAARVARLGGRRLAARLRASGLRRGRLLRGVDRPALGRVGLVVAQPDDQSAGRRPRERRRPDQQQRRRPSRRAHHVTSAAAPVPRAVSSGATRTWAVFDDGAVSTR